MKVLVATHHLFAWRGSELVAIELVEELRAAGATVDLFAAHFEEDFIAEALGADTVITDKPEAIDPFAYDLVYSQHQMASRFIPALLAAPQDVPVGPVLVYNHLSPYEPFEAPGPYMERHLAQAVWANSPETAARLAEISPWLSVNVVPNPAPSRFEGTALPAVDKGLKRLLLVSNHLPEEVGEAAVLLQEAGVEVTHLGQGGDVRRLQPEDLVSHDAVLTIGKTVQYALRARRPVFCYDSFSGPGWLTEETFDAACKANFSGRTGPDAAAHPKRTPQALADEIRAGFGAGHGFVRTLDDDRLMPFRWTPYVERLLALAKARHDGAHAARWREVLSTPERRSELALEYEHSRLVAQLYQSRQTIALRARAKRLEQTDKIKRLQAQLKALRSKTSP